MRIFKLVLLTAIITSPVSADSDDSGSSYSSSDWRMAKDGKLIKKERYQKAINELRKVLKKDDENADAWNLLGFASRKSGDLETSASAYSKALMLQPDYKGALEYQGKLFITIGEIESVKDNLSRLTSLCPSGCEELRQLKQALVRLQ